MTLTLKLLFVDKETDSENIYSNSRDLVAGEQLPRLGDSISFDRPEIADMHFVVSDVNYHYDVNGDLDDVLITAESGEYYDRKLAMYEPEFDDVNIDLGDFDAFDNDSDDFGNEFGNDPDDDYDDDSDDDSGKIKI